MVLIEEINKYLVVDFLKESLNYEVKVLELYKKFLEIVENVSIYLEEYVCIMIG